MSAKDIRFSLVPDAPERTAGDACFGTLGQLQAAVTERKYTEAAALVRENLRHLPVGTS